MTLKAYDNQFQTKKLNFSKWKDSSQIRFLAKFSGFGTAILRHSNTDLVGGV